MSVLVSDVYISERWHVSPAPHGVPYEAAIGGDGGDGGSAMTASAGRREREREAAAVQGEREREKERGAATAGQR